MPHRSQIKLYLDKNGTLHYEGLVKGHNSRTQYPLRKLWFPVDIIQVAAGEHHIVFLTSLQELWGFGDNSKMQLGIPTNTGEWLLKPERIHLPNVVPKSSQEADGFLPVSITATDAATFAVNRNGTVWSMGSSSRGLLGLGEMSENTHMHPAIIPGLEDVVDIVENGWIIVALTSKGSLYGWGWNYDGSITLSGEQAGYDDPPIFSPRQIPGTCDIVSIALSSYHTLAIDSKGDVWAIGYFYPELLGESGKRPSVGRHRIPGLPCKAVEVFAGRFWGLIQLENQEYWGYFYTCLPGKGPFLGESDGRLKSEQVLQERPRFKGGRILDSRQYGVALLENWGNIVHTDWSSEAFIDRRPENGMRYSTFVPFSEQKKKRIYSPQQRVLSPPHSAEEGVVKNNGNVASDPESHDDSNANSNSNPEDDVSPGNECIICFTDVPRAVIMPCKHQHCCMDCIAKLSPRICPTCRGEIDDCFIPFA